MEQGGASGSKNLMKMFSNLNKYKQGADIRYLKCSS